MYVIYKLARSPNGKTSLQYWGFRKITTVKHIETILIYLKKISHFRISVVLFICEKNSSRRFCGISRNDVLIPFHVHVYGADACCFSYSNAGLNHCVNTVCMGLHKSHEPLALRKPTNHCVNPQTDCVNPRTIAYTHKPTA